MDGTTALKTLVAEHSERLFGRRLAVAQLDVQPLSISSREVYRVQAADGSSPTLVVKRRSARASDLGDEAAMQTAHEFRVHSAVADALSSVGRDRYSVPRAALALPEHGLLFMELVDGRPIEHLVLRDAIFPWSGSALETVVRECGKWLHVLACEAPPLKLVPPADDEAAALTRARQNHHIYSLIGLSGHALVQAMKGQVERRLRAYRIDDVTTALIEDALSSSLSGFDQRDRQGNLHGKFSLADVLTTAGGIVAIDLEQAGRGSLYLDAGYFIYQLSLATRWRLFNRTARLATLRRAFLTGRAPHGELDLDVLDAFVAYFLVNSLRPGGGVAGLLARQRARTLLCDWARSVRSRQRSSAA